MQQPSRYFSLVFLGLLALSLDIGIPTSSHAAPSTGKGTAPSTQAEHVVLFVLEGLVTTH